MIAFPDILVGLYVAKIAGALGLAIAFYRSFKVFVRTSIARRCFTDGDTSERLGGALFLIATTLAVRDGMTIAVILTSPWTLGTRPLMVWLSSGVTVIAITGYFLAMTAWYDATATRRVRFALCWLVALVAVGALGVLASSLIRPLLD